MPDDRDILDLAGKDDSDILTLADKAAPAVATPDPAGWSPEMEDRVFGEQYRHDIVRRAKELLTAEGQPASILGDFKPSDAIPPDVAKRAQRLVEAWDKDASKNEFAAQLARFGLEPLRGLTRGWVDPVKMGLTPNVSQEEVRRVEEKSGVVGQIAQAGLNVAGAIPTIELLGKGVGGTAALGAYSSAGPDMTWKERALAGTEGVILGGAAGRVGRALGPSKNVLTRGAKGAGSFVAGEEIAKQAVEGRSPTGMERLQSGLLGFGTAALHRAGEAKVRLAASGKADLTELFSEPRAAQAAEWKRAGVPDAEIARRLAEMPETVNAEGNVEGGYKPTAEVLADPKVSETQKAALREAMAQDVETFSSHVDPKTGQGVALGEQRGTGEPRRVVVDPPKVSSTHGKEPEAEVVEVAPSERPPTSERPTAADVGRPGSARDRAALEGDGGEAVSAPTAAAREGVVPPREAGPKSQTAGPLTKRLKGKDWNVIETTADEATGKTRYVLEDPSTGARRTMLGPTSSKVPRQPPVAATTPPAAPKTPGSALLQAMTTPSVPEAASRMKEVVDSVRAVPGRVVKGFRTLGAGIRDATTQFPTLTKENEPAAAAASRSASSVTISKAMGDLARERVREKHGVDSKRFGGALAEDNLRSERANRLKEAEELEAKGDAEGAALARKIAARIPTTIGGKDAAFKTEAEYQAYLKRPEVQAAVKEHVQFWEENKEPLYRIRQDIDPDAEIPSRGLQTGARINLFAVRDAEAIEPGEPRLEGGAAGSKEGNPKNVRVTRSPFSRRVVGSKNGYITDYDEMMANSFNREVEGAAKKQMVDELVKNGDALMGKPGLSKQMEVKLGQPVQEFPIKGGEFPRALYVREGLVEEFERAFKLRHVRTWGLVTAFTKPINRASLTGLADNMVNMFRAKKTPLGLPLSAHTPAEILVSQFAWPVQVVRTFIRLGTHIGNYKGRIEQVARLAEAGAWRNYDTSPVGSLNPVRSLLNLVNTIGAKLDQAARLSLSGVYDKMVAAGRAKDSPTGRREFVNQMGNYQRAAQGAFIRGMTDSGLGPFTNAKATRWANMARALRLNPGLQAASPAQRWWMAMEMFSKMTGAFTTYMVANLATTGTPFGRDGVPFGSVDLGADDEKGRPQHFGFLNVSELGDITRVIGAQAYLTAKKRGLSEQDAQQAAANQMIGQVMTFANTPFLNFGSTAAFGDTVTRWKIAPTVSPAESQFASNLATAAVETNPLVRLALIGWGRKLLPGEVSDWLRLEDQEGRDVGTELETQMSYFAVKPGLAPQNVASLPDRLRFKRTAEYEEDLKRRITTVPIEKAQEWLTKQLEGLTPEEKARIGPRILRYAMRRK